ncbi:HNH endonuclease [Candidatus Dojkabacteria bacterium]|jgi:hypothetical protein|nr:HNH endonuclease [Candidatus Dojkabacteria bacterium]
MFALRLEFNEKLKEIIRDRDGRKCRICGNSELENGKKLDCHHINYDKEDNNPKNLISLCHSCHTKTNHNRKKWTKYFDNLVNIYRDQFQEAIDEQ